jgi:hypothetical protein
LEARFGLLAGAERLVVGVEGLPLGVPETALPPRARGCFVFVDAFPDVAPSLFAAPDVEALLFAAPDVGALLFVLSKTTCPPRARGASAFFFAFAGIT